MGRPVQDFGQRQGAFVGHGAILQSVCGSASALGDVRSSVTFDRGSGSIHFRSFVCSLVKLRAVGVLGSIPWRSGDLHGFIKLAIN